MNTIKLWLDDEREAPPGWVHARTYSEGVKILLEGLVSHCSLDHDLGEQESLLLPNPHSHSEEDKSLVFPTGYHVALYMAEHSIHPEHVTVHSANPVGARAICDLLNSLRPEDAKRVVITSAQEMQQGRSPFDFISE